MISKKKFIQYIFDSFNQFNIEDSYFYVNGDCCDEIFYGFIKKIKEAMKFFNTHTSVSDNNIFHINKNKFNIEYIESDGIKETLSGNIVIQYSVELVKNSTMTDDYMLRVEFKNFILNDITAMNPTNDTEVVFINDGKFVKTLKRIGVKSAMVKYLYTYY